MLTYIVKRLLAMIPTLFGISLITFFIVLLAPGDPVATKMGQGGGPSASEGGGRSDPQKQADVKKAKMKLLGMLEELHSVVAWDGSAAAASRDWTSDDRYRTVDHLQRLDDVGSFTRWVHAIATSPDGSRLYAGTAGGELAGFDVRSGSDAVRFEDHASGIYSLGCSPDGRYVASADGDGTVRLALAADGRTVATHPALGRAVRALVFLPGGAQLVSACDDGHVRVHSVPELEVLQDLVEHTGPVMALAASADGSRLFSAGFDARLREWDTASWTVTREIGHHTQTVNAIALSRDGSLLATASDDQELRVFDGSSGEQRAMLSGHYAAATCVAFLADGRTLVSGGRDETVRAWDVELARQTAQAPEAIGAVLAVAASPDGTRVFTAGDSWRKTPVTKQYWRWFTNSLRGDFGRSFSDNKPVIDKIAERLPVTLGLNLLAIVLIYLVSIPLGVHAAVRRGTTFDNVTSAGLFMLWSLPSFFLATMLIMYLSSERTWNVLPSVGLASVNQADLPYLPWLWDRILHLVLPMIALTYSGFASLSRYARTSMLETVQQDFVRTARAKGLPESAVIYKHALRNSLIAIITLVGTLLPTMIGGSVIIELIFSIRGMGLLAFEAILQRDYPVVMAITTFTALLTLVGVLLSDLLYSVADPRITHG